MLLYVDLLQYTTERTKKLHKKYGLELWKFPIFQDCILAYTPL